MSPNRLEMKVFYTRLRAVLFCDPQCVENVGDNFDILMSACVKSRNRSFDFIDLRLRSFGSSFAFLSSRLRPGLRNRSQAEEVHCDKSRSFSHYSHCPCCLADCCGICTLATQVNAANRSRKELSVNLFSTAMLGSRSIVNACQSSVSKALGREGLATMESLNVRVLSYQPILPETLAEIEDTMNRRNCDKKMTVHA